jgi:hypothetical protein
MQLLMKRTNNRIRTTDLTLYNSGSSDLIIDSIVSSSSQLTLASLPISISPGASKMVTLNYKPTNTGSFGNGFFLDTTADLQKIVSVNATVFLPII